MTWPTVQVQFTPKMKLSCCDRSNQVWYVKKTRKGATNVENAIELSIPIGSGANCDEKK